MHCIGNLRRPRLTTTKLVASSVPGVAPKLLATTRALFSPLPGFQRVISLSRDYALPWREQVRLGWQWFEDWLSNLFS